MCFKRLVIGLCLSMLGPLASPAVRAAEPIIVGPDGPEGGSALKPRRPPPSGDLRRWLERRREQKKKDLEERGESQDAGSAAAAEEDPREQNSEKRREPPAPPEPLEAASWRWDLDLIVPHIAGDSPAAWQLEPGPAFRVMGRLAAGKKPEDRSFWAGLRVMALSGSGRSEGRSARFAWTYFGPNLAWEWLSPASEAGEDSSQSQGSRQRISLGWSLISRQGEEGLGDLPPELATRSLGLDGPGFSLEYTYGSSWLVQSDWQLSGGVQLLAKKVLVYAGLGFSLWSAG